MFDEIEKKAEKENRDKAKKINKNIDKGLSALSGHMLDDNFLPGAEKNAGQSAKNMEKTEEFDSRMQELHNKGRKRGRRYSYVGLISSVLIMVVVIIAGYFMYTQVSSMSSSVKENTAEIEAVVDPDNLCNFDYCCLASLRRMNKNKFKAYDVNTGCGEGYIIKELDCENSLKWCEPGPELSPDCIIEGGYVDHYDKNSFTCCLGLVKTDARPMGEDCNIIIPEGSPGIEPGWACIKCGDKICGEKYESKCNCPEDCSIPAAATASTTAIKIGGE